jgi:hypothetical protein
MRDCARKLLQEVVVSKVAFHPWGFDLWMMWGFKPSLDGVLNQPFMYSITMYNNNQYSAEISQNLSDTRKMTFILSKKIFSGAGARCGLLLDLIGIIFSTSCWYSTDHKSSLASCAIINKWTLISLIKLIRQNSVIGIEWWNHHHFCRPGQRPLLRPTWYFRELSVIIQSEKRVAITLWMIPLPSGKRTKSYWSHGHKWPSRNSGFAHKKHGGSFRSFVNVYRAG